MDTKPHLRVAALCLGLSLTYLSDSQAFLGDMMKKIKSGDQKVTSQEMSVQENSASRLLARADGLRNSGKRRQARDAYRSLAKSYSRTPAGAEAQYQYAKLLQEDGDKRRAFEEYENLINNFRNTTKFNESVGAQFDIAEGYRNSNRKGFLGIGAGIQPSQLIGMFEKISEVAPNSVYAPKSLLNVGHIRSSLGEANQAIIAYRMVVDNYRGTEWATEAQYKIFELRGIKAEDSNSPVEDRAQVNAGVDFMQQNPNDQRTQQIQQDLREIEQREMEKQFNIGMQYEKAKKPDSARVYYREVIKNPNTPWAAKAQERLNALDRAASQPSIEQKASFFGPNPLKRNKVEMKTSDDSVVPLPVSG